MAYMISSGESSDGIILTNDSMTVLDGGVANNTEANDYSFLYVSSRCRPRICHRTWVSTTARAAVSECCETEDEISNCVPFLSGAADSPPRQGIVPCA